MNNDCLYCNKNQTQKELMIEVGDLKVSTLYLFKEQSHKGRCIVAYKDHQVELHDLNDEELLLFMADVTSVANAMNELYKPAKINYGAFSDKLPHLHFHLVPKYVDGVDYGATFAMNLKQVYLSDSDYAEIVSQYRSKLGL